MTKLQRLHYLALVLLTACGLTASQIGGLVRGSMTFACSTAATFVPPSALGIETTVCKDAIIGEQVIEGVIEAAASASKSLKRLPGDTVEKGVSCAGGIVASVPAFLAPQVQRDLDAKPECRR